jgi:arylsulfatase A-like enzyme
MMTTPKNIGLPPSHPTLPSLLKKTGYATALVGKWHLGYLPDFSPLKSGYDHFYGIFSGAADYFKGGNRIHWLASYPKSGNTWMRVFFTNLSRDSAVPAHINRLLPAGLAELRAVVAATQPSRLYRPTGS